MSDTIQSDFRLSSMMSDTIQSDFRLSLMMLNRN
jgi:hypothetical protein